MKEKVVKFVKEKKKILVIAAIILCIIVIAVIVAVVTNDKEPVIVEKPYVPEIKNTTEILEEGKIEVTDFSVKYNNQDKRWYLSMNVNNSSDKEIDLKDYSLRLYADELELVILPGTTLGKVPAKSGVTSIIALEERFKKTNYIEIFKNEKKKKED